MCGTLAGSRLIFLPRHGRGHRLLPTEVNFRANIFGMKQLGAEWVDRGSAPSAACARRSRRVTSSFPISSSTAPSRRPSTFFGNGIVAHVAFADPFCPVLGAALTDAATAVGATVHARGTYVCMEGPQFSTRAESKLYRQWGADVIGMTNLQEAKLAREAEICFATLALATDYDCWHETEADVVIGDILRMLSENVAQRSA